MRHRLLNYYFPDTPQFISDTSPDFESDKSYGFDVLFMFVGAKPKRLRIFIPKSLAVKYKDDNESWNTKAPVWVVKKHLLEGLDTHTVMGYDHTSRRMFTRHKGLKTLFHEIF